MTEPAIKKMKKSGRFEALPEGSFPTMITPFQDDGSIDYPCLRGLIEWYIESGCVGLFACCLSSEMYHLSRIERLEIARFVGDVAKDRVAVVASGTFDEGSIEQQAQFATEMAAIPYIKATVVLPCQMAKEDEDEDVLKANLSKLLELTECAMGLYECPVPYHRCLSPSLLKWAVSTNRFLFHKDTCCDPELIKAKVEAVQSVPDSPFRFYNANVETLLYSDELGAAGFSGISANFYPWLHARLCARSPHPKLTKEQMIKVQRFLSVAERVVVDNYPACSKVYLAQYDGFKIQPRCRKGEFHFNKVQHLHLRHMKEMMEDLCKELKIAPVVPKMP